MPVARVAYLAGQNPAALAANVLAYYTENGAGVKTLIRRGRVRAAKTRQGEEIRIRKCIAADVSRDVPEKKDTSREMCWPASKSCH